MIGDFGEYLAKKKFIQDKHIPYYIKWVSSCYLFHNRPDDCVLSPEQIYDYLKHISKAREAWQVKQADYSSLKVRGDGGVMRVIFSANCTKILSLLRSTS